MKKLLILFGVFDIITLARNYKQIIPSPSTWTDFPLLGLSNSFLYLSLIFSAFFLIRQSKIGLWLTYLQFPLRMTFLVLSLGFLLLTTNFLNKPEPTYRIMLWILIGLEFFRLILTILIHKKYFSKSKVAVI